MCREAKPLGMMLFIIQGKNFFGCPEDFMNGKSSVKARKVNAEQAILFTEENGSAHLLKSQ
jgi:hypothetical protein